MLWLLACTASGTIELTSGSGADAPEDVGGYTEVDPTDAIFDPTLIATIAVTMDPAAWSDIRDNPWAEVWYPATFQWGDEVVENIGMRAFGQGSEIAGKPALKFSFDKFVTGRTWRDLDELKLDNSSQDVGFLDEFAATAIMRRLGVPAARTGWARVSVNGAAAGFFVVLESIDDRFVERWFGDDDGVLYGMNSGYYAQGLNPMTDGLTWFEPQTSVDSDGTDLVALSGIVANGTDEELAAAINLEEFGRESVARSVMGSMDAFSADGNNYYLYDHHGQWHILPWDFDVDLGAYYFDAALTVDARAPWLTSPWSWNPVTGAAYTDPVLTRSLEMGLDVDGIIAEIIAGPMAFETVDAEIAAAARLIHDDVHADVLGYGPYFDQRAADIRLFVHTRLSRLAGREVATCEASGIPLSAMGPTGPVGWGALMVDSTNWGPGFTVNGEHSCTGVFAHAPSTVAVTIPAGVTRLTGRVGMQDWVSQCGDGGTFAIVQNGVALWESGTVMDYSPSVAFDIDVSAGALTLEAGVNTEYSCDRAVWVDVFAT